MPFFFGWLLNGLYLLILSAVSPVLVFRRITQGKYRHGWREKLIGRLSRRYPDRMCLWFHAVSVGEVLQLQKVLEETQARFPTAELFVTVTTETGYDVARTKYPQHTVSYFPLDFTWAVNNALSSIRPDLIVLVELELWPNLILIARQRQIPLALINGRMGEKSFRGYSRLKPLMRRLLSRFEILAVQTETYADRLRALGAPGNRVVVTGNIKFDRVESDRDNSKTMELRTSFKFNAADLIFIAGSTQDPEESYALDAWLVLRTEFPSLRLILVPRHKERFDEVAALIRQRGCPLVRRSKIGSSTTSQAPLSGRAEVPAVALLDTLGELAACWGLADIAFVGGSLTNRGGQNMIEPAGYGAAVLFGPNTWNFEDIAEGLLSQRAARVVNSPEELCETIRQLLRQPDESQRLGQAASAFAAAQRGATQRTVDLIAKIVTDKSPGEAVRDPWASESTRPNWCWPVLKWILFVIVLVFVGRRALQLWKVAPPESIHVNGLWLIPASLAYFIGGLPSVWFWRALLRGMRQRLDWRDAIRAYYVGHLGKYIPGKAMVLVIRGTMAKDAGVNPVVAGVTAAYETLLCMVTGAALGLAFAPLAFGIKQWHQLPTWLHGLHEQPILIPLIVIVATFVTTPCSAWLCTKIGLKAMPREMASTEVPPSISAGLISRGVAIISLGWACHALSLGCVVQSVSEGPFEIARFPIWLVACTLSTVGGFVVLIAPGGLGVREGLLIEALKDQPQIGPTKALVAAGLLRAVWFVTELVAAGILFVARPKTMRP